MTLEASRAALQGILNRAPEIQYSPNDMKDVLAQPMTWDIRSGVVTVGAYVARNLTATSHLVGIIPEVRTDSYLQPSQLNRQESAELTKILLKDAPLDEVDQDGNSGQQMVREIEKDTSIGRAQVQISIQERQFLADLLARGKIRVDATKADLPEKLEFPDFPY